MMDIQMHYNQEPAGRRRARSGFTLIELLVVLGITAILMFILFIPLSKSLDLSARGRARVEGQDKTRVAMRRIRRELANAMHVYEPRQIQVWGYSAWQPNRRNRPVPAAGATPEPYLMKNGIIAFHLPKHRYYCVQGDHAITPDDGVPFGAAIDVCPRDGQAPVEFRPLQPLEASENMTAYFVGLKNPGLQAGGGPVYDNMLLFRRQPVTPDKSLNTYALYRVEWNPNDLRPGGDAQLFANWLLANGQPNPAFFYDTATDANGTPYWQNWKNRAIQIMEVESADVMRWVQDSSGKFVPQSLITFQPSVIESEVADANRTGWQNDVSIVRSSDVAPVEYGLDHGHWVGWPAQAPPALGWVDGLSLIPDALQLGPNAAGGVTLGPRVQILEQITQGANNGQYNVVFDSAAPMSATNPRNRLVAYSAKTGKLFLGVQRNGYIAQSPPAADYAGGNMITDFQYVVRLDADAAMAGGLPASFGAAKASTRFRETTSVVPFSEVVQVVDRTGASPVARQLHRKGWKINGDNEDPAQPRIVDSPGLDRPVQQDDLKPGEYYIDYRRGVIALWDPTNDPAADSRMWSGVNTTDYQIVITYQFQTNAPKLVVVGTAPDERRQVPGSTDMVQVSYSTKELQNLKLGVVQYTRRNGEALPFEASERVVIRNLKR